MSFKSNAILTGQYYYFFKLPSERYRVVTRSQTKAVGKEMPKVHMVDKVVVKVKYGYPM